MKKSISILLAILMIFSCFGMLPALAAEEDTTKKPLSDTVNEMVGIDFTKALENPDLSTYESLANADSTIAYEQAMLNGVDFMGLSIDYMYNSKDPIYWPSLSVSRSDLALVYGNLNTYLLRMKKEKLNDYRFYTNDKATKICNIIGHLYDPTFKDITISFDNNPTTSDIFYRTICERSGLTEWIQQQWIDPIGDTYYVALCTTLGMRLDDLPAPERDIKDASRVAPLLVKSIVEYKASGPFAHLVEILHIFTRTYNYYLSKSIIPFFAKYWDTTKGANPSASYYIQKDQLMSFKTLLNVISNGNGTKAGRLECITPPSYRFAKSTDEVESFLYLMIYCNLLGAFKNNKSVVQAYKNSIDASPNYDATQKERIKAIVGMMFEGKFAEAEPTISNISQEIITSVPNNIKNALFGFFGRFLDGLYGFFDKIYQAIRKFL
ncbi:MAG: hypothetical protein IJU56_08220 [Clostridia bacterium]|nr:hypothetical protein [Clostridia bacterium]